MTRTVQHVFKSRHVFRFLGLLCCALSTITAAMAHAADESTRRVTILEWNIEAGGSDPAEIARQLKSLEPFDILALSEVPQDKTADFAARWKPEAAVVGESGGPQRMLIAWNPALFEKLDAKELRKVGDREFAPGLQSAALVVRLKHKSSGREFSVIMNHFARGSAELRKTQAVLLSEWGKEQSGACFAIGGYNFDYDFRTQKGNESFDAFMAAGVWKWNKPKELIDNNWADRNRDGQDDYPDSILDYTFVNQAAESWKIESEVVVRASDFPDDDKTSDHRPMRIVIDLPK